MGSSGETETKSELKERASQQFRIRSNIKDKDLGNSRKTEKD